MNPVRIVLQFFYELLCIPLALIGVPIVTLFAKWDDYPTTFTGGAMDNGPPTVRGDLPRWAAWFGTFDERLPGGMYEPSVVKVYNRFGRYICSLYWLIVRNRMFGLMKTLFGRPIGKNDPTGPWKTITLGPLLIGWGYRKYRATPDAHWIEGPFVEVYKFTIRLRRD